MINNVKRKINIFVKQIRKKPNKQCNIRQEEYEKKNRTIKNHDRKLINQQAIKLLGRLVDNHDFMLQNFA